MITRNDEQSAEVKYEIENNRQKEGTQVANKAAHNPDINKLRKRANFARLSHEEKKVAGISLLRSQKTVSQPNARTIPILRNSFEVDLAEVKQKMATQIALTSMSNVTNEEDLDGFPDDDSNDKADNHGYSLTSTIEQKEEQDAKDEILATNGHLPPEIYAQHGLIDTNDINEIYRAGRHYNHLTDDQKNQLKNHYKELIIQSKTDPYALANAYNYVENLEAKTNNPTAWKALPKEVRAELLQRFLNTHKLEYRSLVGHGLLGYVGEIAYIYWDYVARVEICEFIFRSLPEDGIKYANAILTIPIASANLTYNPIGDAKAYMQNKMLFPDKTFTNAIKSNKLLALAFAAYASAGGYVEVVQINDFLEDTLGAYGKFVPIVILVYAAIAYYTAFNFADTIDGCKDWKDSSSLLKKAFSLDPNVKVPERIIALVNSFDEFFSFLERLMRMGYGGFEAGAQQINYLSGIIIGSFAALGTAPVVVGTRVMTRRRMYHMSDMEKYEAAALIFEVTYKDKALLKEAKLFFSPTLLLEFPLAYLAFLGPYEGLDGPAGAALGTFCTVATIAAMHLMLRQSNKQIEIVSIANKRAAEEKQPDPDEIRPNKAAVRYADFCNFTDQASRTLTMGYVLTVLLPDQFDQDTQNGRNMLYCMLSLIGYIALSAYMYQGKKTADTFASILPFFRQKPAADQKHLGTPLMTSSTPANEKASAAEKLHILHIDDEQNESPDDDYDLDDDEPRSRYCGSRCSIM
jgi:hypothetical protein